MHIENLCAKRLFQDPADTPAISHKYLLRGGYIHQTAQGIFTFSPLGWRIMLKIMQIIREEMNALSGQEVFMPIVGPASLWQETNRYDKVDVLERFKSRHGAEYVLNPTHEEIIVDFVRNQLSSHRQLPFMLYQIQTKFRAEARARGGLLRTREFIMKDGYSFHKTEEDLKDYYAKVHEGYVHTYRRMGMKNVVSIESSSGDMGGAISHEFMLLTDVGEDTVYLCQKCDYKANKEIIDERGYTHCPTCGGDFRQSRGVEIGNIFQLGTKYAKDMNCTYQDTQGQKQYPIMGCYGIGVGRAMAALIEESHDSTGPLWPLNLAPFQVHICALKAGEKEVRQTAHTLYETLTQQGWEVLLDDRDVNIGEMFTDADLIGAPVRLIISPRNMDKAIIEVKYRLQSPGSYPTEINPSKVSDLLKEIFTTPQR